MTWGLYLSHFVTGTPLSLYCFLIYCPVNSSWWVIAASVCSDTRYCWWENNSDLFCLTPLIGAAPNSLLSLSQKQPLCCLLSKLLRAKLGGLLSEAFWDPTETLLHWSPLVTRNRGCFWSFPISPCVSQDSSVLPGYWSVFIFFLKKIALYFLKNDFTYWFFTERGGWGDEK